MSVSSQVETPIYFPASAARSRALYYQKKYKKESQYYIQQLIDKNTGRAIERIAYYASLGCFSAYINLVPYEESDTLTNKIIYYVKRGVCKKLKELGYRISIFERLHYDTMVEVSWK